jgi:hypothetical protein
MSQETSTQQQKAKHLAARAVMAYRAGFPIEELSISTKNAPRMGIVCNWKELRAAYGDDTKLLRRGLAFVYIGTIIDQEGVTPPSEELRKEVLADQSSAIEARQTAVEWGLAPAVTDTDPFAHGGYKLASRLLRNDRSLVDSLVQELCVVETMNQEQLQSWFDRHADSLVLEELERSVTF